jgi:hypothetical protein
MENKQNYKVKMKYINGVILPNLELAFQRGDEKYHGIQHSHSPRIIKRSATDDINHVRELHVDVRLREAEDFADGEDLGRALHKIESAIGYLVILHMRTKDKNDLKKLEVKEDYE